MANYTDNLNQLWGIPELEAQQKAAVALVKSYLREVTTASKKLREIQMGIGGMGDMSAMKTNAKQIEALTNQQIKSIKALADAKLKEARAEEALSRARLNAARLEAAADKQKIANQREIERQTKVNAKAQADLAKQQEKVNIQLQKENNAYEQRKKLYNEQAALAKRLIFEKGKDNQETIKAIALAKQYHTELMNAEAAVGQFQRQVGNYNVVGAQFQQLLRELPNAGISARTFVMAISNNVTYFAESVKEARSQGQSWGNILKTLGGSLFSLVGVLNIALAVFTYFALNSDKAAESTQTLTERIDDLTESTINYIQAANQQNQVLRAGFNQGSQAQQRYIDLLTAQGASEAEIAKERTKLHKIRIDEFESEIEQYNNVEKAVIDYAKAVKRGGDSMEATQERLTRLMQDGLGLSAEEAAMQAEKIKSVTTSLAEEGKKISLDNFEFLQGILFERLKLEDSIKDELSAIEVERAEFEKNSREKAQKEAEKSLRDYYKRLRDIEKERGAPALLPTLEDIKRQTEELRNANISNEFQQAIFGNEQDEKYALRVLEEQFSQGLISVEDYEAQRLKIQNDYASQRIRLEIETTKKLLAAGGMDEGERLKLISRLNDLELELVKSGNNEKLKAEQDYKKASEQLEKERKDRIKQIRQELTQAVLQFGSFVLENERRQLETSKRRIDDEKQVELAFIEATSASQEEAARRKFALEQKSLAQKQQLQKKEEQIERNRFLLEQAAALARVLINANEAVAKITAQAAVLSSNPVTAALAAGAYAQIPIVYGSAAVQAGLIAAQTIAYAEGTPEGGHRGGAALVGEAGEAEYVKEPNKKGYWVTEPTYFKDMPLGTEVTPLHKLEAGGLDKLDGKALNAIMLQGGGNSARTEALLSDAINELKAIKGKPQSEWIVKGNAMYEIVTKGNSKNVKLGKRFID